MLIGGNTLTDKALLSNNSSLKHESTINNYIGIIKNISQRNRNMRSIIFDVALNYLISAENKIE